MCKNLFVFISLRKLIALCSISLVAFCASASEKSNKASLELIDTQATAETKALFKNLQKLRGHQFLFGQQDTLAYGFKWNGDADKTNVDRSDAKDVTGSHVALVGWDLGGLENQQANNIDGVSFEKMRAGIKSVYLKGGVNTISWHVRNPDGGEYKQKPSDPKAFLVGGSKHEEFKHRLDLLAEFNESLKVGKTYIPIIFRPWHEHNGEWFWWGKGNISEQDYVDLWRFTLDYLRNVKHIHNFIIASSPDRGRIDLKNFATDYLYAYPGDNYVDIMGFDDYWDLGHEANKAPAAEQLANFIQSLTEISKIAAQHHKLAALTEGGTEAIHNPNFFTQVLLAGMTANADTRQFVYAMVWRNATDGGYNGHHFYVPYPGHAAVNDFIKFKKEKAVIFLNEVPKLYH